MGHTPSIAWQVLAYAILTAAEVLISITCLEFSYTQAPNNMKSFIMAIVGAEYILNLLPKGTHEYDCLIKPSELEKWSREAGLTLVDLIGVSYNPLTKSFKLTNDVSVNYMIHFKK